MIHNIPVSAAIIMAFLMIASCNDYASDSTSPESEPSIGSQVLNPASQNQRNFRAHLTGDAENPVVETQAQGQVTIQFSKDESSFHFKLIAANIENITQAHIHCGTADVNGPVVLFLYPDEPPATEIPGTFNGVLAEGERTNEDVIARPDSDVCPGGVADFDDLVSKIRNGEMYVNVHTTQNPGGEIRGHIF